MRAGTSLTGKPADLRASQILTSRPRGVSWSAWSSSWVFGVASFISWRATERFSGVISLPSRMTRLSLVMARVLRCCWGVESEPREEDSGRVISIWVWDCLKVVVATTKSSTMTRMSTRATMGMMGELRLRGRRFMALWLRGFVVGVVGGVGGWGDFEVAMEVVDGLAEEGFAAHGDGIEAAGEVAVCDDGGDGDEEAGDGAVEGFGDAACDLGGIGVGAIGTAESGEDGDEADDGAEQAEERGDGDDDFEKRDARFEAVHGAACGGFAGVGGFLFGFVFAGDGDVAELCGDAGVALETLLEWEDVAVGGVVVDFSEVVGDAFWEEDVVAELESLEDDDGERDDRAQDDEDHDFTAADEEAPETAEAVGLGDGEVGEERGCWHEMS